MKAYQLPAVVILLLIAVNSQAQMTVRQQNTSDILMQVTAGGNVGIGTGNSEPVATLDVVGSIRFASLNASTENEVIVRNTSGLISTRILPENVWDGDDVGSGGDGVVTQAQFSGTTTKTLRLSRSEGLADVTASFTDRYEANTDNQTLSEVLRLGNDAQEYSAVNFSKIGIGTESVHPEALLQVDGSIKVGGDPGGRRLMFGGLETGGTFWLKVPGAETGSLFQGFKTDSNGDPDAVHIMPGHQGGLTVRKGGRVGIYETNPGYPLQVNVAYCTGTEWKNGSSREYKEDIETLSYAQALEAFSQLQPVSYHYKAEYVDDPDDLALGFIAEDLPELVAERDGKSLNPMKIITVLTKVVQQQQNEIELLKQQINP